jgi:hypothetical protein
VADLRGFALRAALLLVAAVAVAAGLVAWQVARDAARAADRTLATLQSTQALVEAQQDRNLVTRGELIAGNQAVVGYMTQALGGALPGETVDYSSIIDLLEERRSQLGLDVAAVIGADGRLLASTDRYLAGGDFARDPVFAAAAKAQAPRTGLWAYGDRLLHAALLPLARYGSGDAYLLVGETVGQDFAQTIAGIGAADVAIVTRTPAGVPRIPVSTLEADDSAGALDALRIRRDEAGGRFALRLPGGRVQAQSAPLFGNDAVRVLALAQARPVAEVTAAHLPALLLAALAVLGLALALGWHRRAVAAPLQDLERLMTRAAETGDTHLRLAERGAPAVVRVAAAFNRLMAARHAPRD